MHTVNLKTRLRKQPLPPPPQELEHMGSSLGLCMVTGCLGVNDQEWTGLFAQDSFPLHRPLNQITGTFISLGGDLHSPHRPLHFANSNKLKCYDSTRHFFP